MRQNLWIIIILLSVSPVAAQSAAQTAPNTKAPVPDERIAGPTIDALQAMVRLREAEMKAMSEDYEAQKATLIEWLKAAQAPK